MKKMMLTAFSLFLIVLSPRLQAQSLKNTNWKVYIADPLYDTLTLHIKTDSSFVTDKTGTVVVRSVCKASADTLTFSDYDGQYACPGMTGKYKFSVTADVLVFTLIDDPCDGRANSINGLKWMKVPGE